MSHDGAPDAWTVDGDRLRCAVRVHPSVRAQAEEYVLHRLRQLRAHWSGFLHPTDVRLHDDALVVELAPGTLTSEQRASLPDAAEGDLLTLVSSLLHCHEQRVAGFGRQAIVDGRWVVPPGWFLPPLPDVDLGPAMRADLRLAELWAKEYVSRRLSPRERRNAEAVVEALSIGDLARLKRLVQEDRQHAAREAQDSPPVPSLLSLLTEGELMERVAGLYAYRLIPQREAAAMGMAADDREFVLEVDRNWEDPHFPKLDRPTPQEVWDGLVDDSKVTPVLAVSTHLPNPLAKGRQGDVARWIGVHEDQPWMYVLAGEEKPAERGYVRLHLAGDNEVMNRKRAFTSFAGGHPALGQWLASPPPSQPFVDNSQPRDQLEEAVLATRGFFAVQGPPGTGKTHLATQVIRKFLARTPGGRVLVCAKEHFALDHILAKITASLGSDGVPFRAWRSVSLARRRRGGRELDQTWQGPNVVRDLSARSWAPEAVSWADWEYRASDRHDQRLATLGQHAANLYFATTMDAAMVGFLGKESFDLVIVEEAGKCYPSELLHAVCLGRTSLMIGDQRQLPPYQERRTREGVEAWSKALGRAQREGAFRESMAARFGPTFLSLEALGRARGPLTVQELGWLRPFEFLFDRLPARHRLEEQFRMEGPLSRVVGRVFYGRPFDHRKHELVAAGLLAARPLGEVLPPDLDVPLLWLDTPHMTEDPDATEDPHKRGVRDNRYEAAVILRYLQRLRPGAPIDMVILTPYNAQKRLLLENAELRAVCKALTDIPFEQLVRTTDEYQGREAELTVLSLVRNNSLGSRAWGFMTEPERLNVMFSRTRFRQVVVGCSAHVVRHAADCEWLRRVWQAYQEEARDSRCARIVPAREVLRG